MINLKDFELGEKKNEKEIFTFLKYRGASFAISWGKGMHSIMQWRRCFAKPTTVSRKTTSFSCFANIIIRHFLKLRISSHTVLSTPLVADSCWKTNNSQWNSYWRSMWEQGKRRAHCNLHSTKFGQYLCNKRFALMKTWTIVLYGRSALNKRGFQSVKNIFIY